MHVEILRCIRCGKTRKDTTDAENITEYDEHTTTGRCRTCAENSDTPADQFLDAVFGKNIPTLDL